MKQQILKTFRGVHAVFRRRQLPNRIAIYGHELPPEQRQHFAACISHLVSMGYVSVNPREYAAVEGPSKRLFVSFDDNFADWYDSLALFDRLGISCTFYVTSGVFFDRSTRAEQKAFMNQICQPDEKPTLSVTQLKKIVARGHTIGCHTHTHPVLSQLSSERWDREIAHSKRVLERLIDQKIVDFSFPFGMRRDFSSTLSAYCQGLGFQTIATGISGQLYQHSIDPMFVHRTGWKSHLPIAENIKNLQLDARIYGKLFGRSVIG